MTAAPATRVCRTCRVEQPLSAFPIDRASRAGVRAHCRPCWLLAEARRRAKRGPHYAREARRRAYLADPARFLERQRRYRARRRERCGPPNKPGPKAAAVTAAPSSAPARLEVRRLAGPATPLRVRSAAAIAAEIRAIERWIGR